MSKIYLFLKNLISLHVFVLKNIEKDLKYLLMPFFYIQTIDNFPFGGKGPSSLSFTQETHAES